MKLVVNKPVLISSLSFIVASIVFCLIYRDSVDEWFERGQLLLSEHLGWFFILAVNFILIYCLYLAFSKYRNIRLGGDDAEPEFSTMAWFAMLFSAGMGIGIMFFSVAEPVSHFANPPRPVADDASKALQAMQFTGLHWGLHAWGIYALVGLALAFFSFNRKLPLTFRSLFYPFLGDRIHGWWGHTIDIFSVIATAFGLSTSLGLGVQQMNAGLNFLFGWDISIGIQALLIAVVVSVALISVASGLDKGVKLLSQGNIILAFLLMLFIFILGPSIFLLKSYVENIGSYLSGLVDISTWNDAYRDSGWQNKWTVFYWAWWISWSPFVGTFIARISKGRTVQEFVLGVLIIPALITILWMTVFGGTALHSILEGKTELIHAVENDLSTALFVFLKQFPFSQALSILAVLLVAFFFITSSDSGALVIDNITSGNAENTPVIQRIFWAVIQGLIAIILMWGGGLDALQTMVIITGLPFAVILLMMCYSLLKGLEQTHRRKRKTQEIKREKSYRDIVQDLINDKSE